LLPNSVQIIVAGALAKHVPTVLSLAAIQAW
jgi:hypothetical protein